MLHSNHGPISYRFRDKRRFPSKIAEFYYLPVHLTRRCPLMRFPLELGSTGWPQETRLISRYGRSLATSLAVWIQYTTRRTDRQTPADSKYTVPRLCIESRGKNVHVQISLY